MSRGWRGLGAGHLGSQAVALGLYALLVVLPSAVFGGLHGYQLWTDHSDRLREVPDRARTSSLRVLAGVHETIDALIASEEAREWYVYQNEYYVRGINDEVPFLTSPLVMEARPPGIQAWFAYDYLEGIDARVQLFGGSSGHDAAWQDESDRLLRLLEREIRKDATLSPEAEAARLTFMDTMTMPLPVVGVNLSPLRDTECVKQSLEDLGSLEVALLDIDIWAFHLRLLREDDGTLRLMATRRVQIEDNNLPLDVVPDCFVENGFDAILNQGFFLDPEWFFATVPVTEARKLLSESERFLLTHDSGIDLGEEAEVAEFDMITNYAIEVEDAADLGLGRMRVAVDRSRIEAAFGRSMTRFVGLAAMMIVSLATGMWLLVRSVQHSRAAARRTENFVAAVSHELRTPIAAVKMYGEMLHEGWVRDADKQADYLARILREADRLDSLVDRVLQKRSLAAKPPRPTAADLGSVVSEKVPDLLSMSPDGGQDVVLDVQEGLPPVMLVPEAVHGVLTNLVDNARKYATGDLATGPHEPISIVVREHKSRVVLEVLDRGPGIPEEERSRIFQAFYRVGDERTRKRPGTGLGLHLVWLQCNLMGARVQALARPGGGTMFRVSFRSARAGKRSLPALKSKPSAT